MPDSDGPAEAQPDNGAIPENQVAEPVASSADTKQEKAADQPDAGNRETLGGTLKDHFVRGVQSTGAVRAARRMYDLTYGSSMAHGDKLVQREQLAQEKMQDNDQLSHRQALHTAKSEIRNKDIQSKLEMGPEKK